MKEFWLELSPNLPNESLYKLVEAAGPDAILLTQNNSTVRGRVASHHPDANIFVTSDFGELEAAKRAGKVAALEITVLNRRDHQTALKLLDLQPDYLLIRCPGWKIIPLENLVADAGRRTKLVARTSSLEESRTALKTLEFGVDGIALFSDNPEEILKTRELLTEGPNEVLLSSATVARIRSIGIGSRACVDTCEVIGPNEGLLTGCSSQALFLVEGEVHASSHIDSRPFRVNAGPVSLYVLMPGGKTRYLSELSAGDAVLLVNDEGRTRTVDVARVKIERRPMILVEAESEGRTVKTILQNAETVRLVSSHGSKTVSDLTPGCQLLVRLERGGRHFGTSVPEELIIER